MDIIFKDLIYDNPLASPEQVRDFKMEGTASVTFENGRMRLTSLLYPGTDEEENQDANLVYWCPEEFPSNIAIKWDFWPVSEPGLCMLIFAARGINGEDVFDESLAVRRGRYEQYNRGDINMLHISYFRRRKARERGLNVINLRKSYGFKLVAQGADPIPSVVHARPPYSILLVKLDNEVAFYINDLLILKWTDDGSTYGPVLGGGKIGFRQMAPMIAEYANFKVYTVEKTQVE